MVETDNNRISEIISWYPEFTEKQKESLLKIMNYGRIAGSGKFVILPVDQGFEHGPGRSFEPNPKGYNPVYHAELAVDSGCNAYAAPLGQLEAANDKIKEKKLPAILKVNSNDLMMPDKEDSFPAITSWVNDAVRLDCAAVGITIYPGSAHSREMYQQVQELVRDARKAGLVVVIWAYPRGSGFYSKEVETAVDVVCYGVHIAAQLGAHIIKCKPTKELLGLPEDIRKDAYKGVAIETLAQRTKLVIRAAFDGRRIVINSGGEKKNKQDILEEVRQLKAGGSFGSIVGRNAFQRPKKEAIGLLHNIQDIHIS